MKLFLVLCLALAVVSCVSASVTMYHTDRCIGLKERMNDKESIAYMFCCDGGFDQTIEFTDYASIKYSNDCKKVLDEYYDKLTPGKANCSKSITVVNT